MILFWILFLILLIIYSSMAFTVFMGWKKTEVFNPPKNTPFLPPTFISVIIALRNEIKEVDRLVSCLVEQDYPKSFYEVLFVDDHSEDNTSARLRELIQENTQFQLLSLTENEYGKKAAVACGIKMAKGEICAFLDADCLPGKNWLTTLNNFYTNQGKPDMIIGLVDLIPKNNILNACFRLEFASLVITGSGLAARNRAVYCNGANLAIKKPDIKELTGLNPKIISGDDVFLLHHFKKHKKSIKVLFSKDHLVYTNAPNSIGQFINQRIRWASKTTSYSDIDAILLSLLVLLLNVCFVIGYFLGPFTGHTLLIFFIFLYKMLVDLIVFYSGTKILSIKRLFIYIPLVEFFYPFYILLTAVLAIKKPFEWKGRYNR